MTEKRCNNQSSCSAYAIWRNYAIGTGPVAFAPLICHFLPAVWYPLAPLLMSLVLFIFVGNNRKSLSETCMVVPYMAARVLLLFAVVTALLIILHCCMDSREIAFYNRLSPDFSMLLLAPAAFLLVGIMHRRGSHNTLCEDCMLRNGTPYERAALGHIYYKENPFLIPRLLKLYALLSIAGWGYYVFFFDDKSVSKFDDFIFLLSPIVVYIIDNLLLAIRYFLIGIYYDKKGRERGTTPYDKDFKRVRILLISVRGIYFVKKKVGYSTPFEFRESYSDRLSMEAARQYMVSKIGFVSPGAIRFCYGSSDLVNRRRIEHYMCFVDDESVTDKFEEGNKFQGRWWNKKEVEQAFYGGLFDKMTCTEIHRIFTVMHTSKIYDSDGKRIVKSKDFEPSFSLAELRGTKVDFSDNRWMILSKFNRTRRMGIVRHFWYKYIEGMY